MADDDRSPLRIEVYPRGTLGPVAGPPPPPPGFQLITPDKVGMQGPPAPPPGFQIIEQPPPPPAGFKLESQPDATDQEMARMERESSQGDRRNILQKFFDEPPTQAGEGFFSGFAKPLTRPFQEQPAMAREGVETMQRGAEMFKGGDKLAGGLTAAGGALEYGLSPINAPLRTFFGKPTEKAFGIPKETTETVVGLALPGIGFGGQIRQALKPLERLISPATVSPVAEDAASILRSTGGRAARDTETTAAAMEPFHRMVNTMPEADRLHFLDYVEGGHSGPVSPQLQQLADSLKEAFDLRKSKLQAMPSTATMHFIDEYFPHFWQDPRAAQQFVQNWSGGASKQGSGASLRARTVPTIADGIAAGLRPLTTDPIAATMRYVQSMDRFIASTEALDTAVAQGTVRYVRPRTMGASGLPDSFKVPPGYVALEGRGARRADGAMAYAPKDWADVYNNFISRGVHDYGNVGSIYDAALHGSNAITAMELGLSGFHAFTMANEAFISDLAKGVSQLAGGKPLRAVGSLVTAPAAPITRAIQGHKAEQVYLGRTPGTPDLRRAVDLLTEAGARMVGKAHSKDYQFSAMNDFWTSWKRGALRLEYEAARQRVLTAQHPIARGSLESAKLVGRAMETVAYPLFVKYIPKIKNGAAVDTLNEWIRANPNATHAEQLRMARRIWDSIDNRFGEMVQDNLFWNAFGRQAAQLGMRSFSWNLGTAREIGGGVVSALRDPSKLSIASKDYDPRVAYVFAFPIGVASLSAAYQYLKTGKRPENIQDLMAGRTGGTAPGFAGGGQVPERISLPGYQKDVFGWYNDWQQEAVNKIATGPRLAGETLSALGGMGGKDWRGDPFIRPDPTIPQWLADYTNHVANSFVPISIKGLAQGEKEGSAITRGEQIAGFRPAPSALQDPEGTEKGMKRLRIQAWQRKMRHDAKQKKQFGGYE